MGNEISLSFPLSPCLPLLLVSKLKLNMNTKNPILIIDDEPDVFDVLEGILFKEGHQLNYAPNGVEAIKFLESSLPDLIILDLMIPDCDGIEICRQIKQVPEWHPIPIIIITALNSKETLAQCLDAGADDFIAKPVSSVEVRARVRAMLRIKKQYDQLEQSNRKLEQLLQLREDMAHAVIHDLRTPIFTILLASELLKQTSLTVKQIQKLNQIEQSGQRLNSMIDSLLLMAKLESGKDLLNPKPTNLRDIIESVVYEFSPATIKKQIELTVQIPESERWVIADSDLIQRVLENLLNNAIKFAPKQSQVIIEIEHPTRTNTVKVHVKDWGQGIKAELKQSIFQKFEIGQRFENVAQTGLGLAFCKMVIDAHNGYLSVSDNQPQGAIFTFELPDSTEHQT